MRHFALLSSSLAVELTRLSGVLHSSTAPTSLFLSHNEALVPPYRVLVDTNFINLSLENRIEMVRGMMDTLYAKCTSPPLSARHSQTEASRSLVSVLTLFGDYRHSLHLGLRARRVGEARTKVSPCTSVRARDSSGHQITSTELRESSSARTASRGTHALSASPARTEARMPTTASSSVSRRTGATLSRQTIVRLGDGCARSLASRCVACRVTWSQPADHRCCSATHSSCTSRARSTRSSACQTRLSDDLLSLRL